MTPAILFPLLIGLLVLASLVPILLPLLRARESVEPKEEDARPSAIEEAAALWREQREQLDAEVEAGLIDQAQYDTALAALAQAARSDLAGEEDARDRDAQRAARATFLPRRRIALSLGLLVVALGIAIPVYLAVGGAFATASGGLEGRQQADGEQGEAIVQALADKLKNHPEDRQGWQLLGRSYMMLGRFPDAAQAFKHAQSLAPEDASVLADLADAVAMQAGGRLAGEPSTLIAKALEADPNNPKALELAGSAALQQGDPIGARTAWQHLRAVLPPGSDDVKQVDAALAQLDAAISAKGGAPVPASSKAAPTAPPVAAGRASVSGTVDIAPSLAGSVAITDVVYLSARDARPNGSRLPLAVMRLEAKQLPATFQMTDEMAMDASAKLSDAKDVILEAHIAKHGTPITTAGDLASLTAQVPVGTSGVKLVIDHVVK